MQCNAMHANIYFFLPRFCNPALIPHAVPAQKRPLEMCTAAIFPFSARNTGYFFFFSPAKKCKKAKRALRYVRGLTRGFSRAFAASNASIPKKGKKCFCSIGTIHLSIPGYFLRSPPLKLKLILSLIMTYSNCNRGDLPTPRNSFCRTE